MKEIIARRIAKAEASIELKPVVETSTLNESLVRADPQESRQKRKREAVDYSQLDKELKNELA